ncbi:OsmC family protein [Brachybacterium sp. DNPG3]
MPVTPDDRFETPEAFGPGSVWADRTGSRRLIGRNQRGVEIPIGLGEGEIDPGELLKLALIGCAGMSADVNLSRRLGEDFPMRLWAHGQSDPETNRYDRIAEQVQLDLDGLSGPEIERIAKVLGRAIAVGCTVERTVVPGVEVDHELLGAPETAPETEGERA